jgi:hypothetical protein
VAVVMIAGVAVILAAVADVTVIVAVMRGAVMTARCKL